MNSIVKYVPDISLELPDNGERVLVGGCFDILHYGHLRFLEAAKAEGDYLIVALEPDSTIINQKSRNPVHTQIERAFNLSSLRWVDLVLLLPPLSGFEAYMKLTSDVSPNIIAITEGDPQLVNKQLQADALDAKLLKVVPHLGDFSSSQIYQRLSEVV